MYFCVEVLCGVGKIPFQILDTRKEEPIQIPNAFMAKNAILAKYINEVCQGCELISTQEISGESVSKSVAWLKDSNR